ncbi:MAG: hypothetical protein ABSF32_06805 [Ignavibacteria bacterium]|jgi:hypothetical protein
MLRDNTFKDYLYLDTLENAIDSLEMVNSCLSLEHYNKWKWIIIAMHHSLYSFCIANLQGTSPNEVTSKMFDEDDNVYAKRGDEKWKKSKINCTKYGFGSYTISWEEIEGEPPITIKENKKNKPYKEKLIPFWTAIARVQSYFFWMSTYIHSKEITLTEDEWESIIWLNDFRNLLIHFIPTSIAYHKNNFIGHFNNCIDVIERLVFKTNQIHFYLDRDNDKKRIQGSINQIRTKLDIKI